VLDGITDRSVGNGRKIELSPDVRELCDAMLARLEAVTDGGAPCASSR
jgi:hypothetical protein